MSTIPSNCIFYPLIQLCIDYATDDINNNKLKSAGFQLNLIHNFPLEHIELSKWDQDHFFEFEVPVYFENEDNPQRIKNIIVKIADIIKQLD